MKAIGIKWIFVFLILGSLSAFGQKSQKREVSAFSEIALMIGANVHLTQGATQSVEIRADETTLANLLTEVGNRKLTIRYAAKSWFKTWNPGRVELFITVPQIESLTLSGSGSIDAEGPLNSRILNLAISGSGNINLMELTSEKLSAIISGSGNIKLAGKETGAELNAKISGSGNVKASDSPFDKVSVDLSGSGNCKVHPVKSLQVRISGSGSVVYSGDPQIDSSVLGSGRVTKE